MLEAARPVLPPFSREVRKHGFSSVDWSTLLASKAGRDVRATYLSPAAIKRARVLRPAAIQAIQLALRALPRRAVLYKKLDGLLGVCLGLQVLHFEMISKATHQAAPAGVVDHTPLQGVA